MFKIAMLISVFITSDGEPYKMPALVGNPFATYDACEGLRTSEEFGQAVAGMSLEIAKKFNNAKVSIATACIETGDDSAPKGHGI